MDEKEIIQWDTSTGESMIVPHGLEYRPGDFLTNDGLAVGAVIPRGSKTAIRYLENSREYNQRDAGIHRQIQLSNQMYHWEGIVGTTIDLFVDFSITDFSLEGVPNGSRERAILEYFLFNVNKDNHNMEKGMRSFLKEVSDDYYLAGNSFIFKSYSQVSGSEIPDKRIRGTRGWRLPMNLYLLNPLYIEIPEAAIIVGNKQIWFKLDETNVEIIRQDPEGPQAKAILEGLPQEMQNQLIEEGKILLPPELVDHIKRKSKGYLAWGRPYLSKAFGAFARKKKLEALDEATIDGLINRITVFKVGMPNPKDENDWRTWSKTRQQAFSAHLRGLNPSNLLVWGPDIDVIDVGPKDSLLGFDQRYAQVDRDILKALGIPTVLISGEGASADRSENVWVSISGLLEKLQNSRDQFQVWLEGVLWDILKVNELPTNNKPVIRWTRMNLRNEKELRDFVLALYDRGILPIETTVKEAKYDWEVIKAQRLTEIKEKIDGKKYADVFTRRDLPFSGSGGAPGAGAPYRVPSNQPKTGRPPGGVLRRPVNTKPKTTVNNKPSPTYKARASVEENDYFYSSLHKYIDKIKMEAIKNSSPDQFIDSISPDLESIAVVFDAPEISDEVKNNIGEITEDYTVGARNIFETVEDDREKILAVHNLTDEFIEKIISIAKGLEND